jgi:hypothetical protein
MTIINLTNHERWKLNQGRRHTTTSRVIYFYGEHDSVTMRALAERGLIQPISATAAHITDLGQQAMDCLDSKKDHEDAIWHALLSTVDRIRQEKPPYGGTSRTAGEYTHHEDGSIHGTCRFSSGNKDGSDTVYNLVATLKNEEITVQIDTFIDHADDFWGPGGPRDNDDPQKRVVVDGKHYHIGEPGLDGAQSFKGFSGRIWEIEFFDGRTARTDNLWCQGVVPPKWRERFPDNARFVPQPPIPSLASRLGLKGP